MHMKYKDKLFISNPVGKKKPMKYTFKSDQGEDISPVKRPFKQIL